MSGRALIPYCQMVEGRRSAHLTVKRLELFRAGKTPCFAGRRLLWMLAAYLWSSGYEAALRTSYAGREVLIRCL
jgi:hypothetical protein